MQNEGLTLLDNSRYFATGDIFHRPDSDLFELACWIFAFKSIEPGLDHIGHDGGAFWSLQIFECFGTFEFKNHTVQARAFEPIAISKMFSDPIQGANDQEVPELLPVVQVWVLARGRVLAEAMHGQLRDVFAVDGAVGVDLHSLDGKGDDPLIVPLPDGFDRVNVARFDFFEPV